MADRIRRYTFSAIVLPFLFLAMSGLARATVITVNTLDGGSDPAPACTLPDAITAANDHLVVSGCAAGTGHDQIVFAVTGTIFVDVGKLPLDVDDEALEIIGPPFGCAGPGPCGIRIDGGFNGQIEGGIIDVEAGSKFFELKNLTLQDGLAEAGGAVFSESGGNVDIRNCLFVNNTAQGLVVTLTEPAVPTGGEGGAIYEDQGSMEITNSTFYHNLALKYDNTFGGAIYVAAPAECTSVPGDCIGGVPSSVATLKLTNDTFEHNYAKTGSAIFNESDVASNVDVKGTIFADHLEKAGTGVTSPLGNCAGNASGAPVTDEKYNLSVDNSCDFTNTGSLNNETADDLALDPAGLQNNGGPTETVALDPFLFSLVPILSDAIDRIPVADCTDQSKHPKPLGTDQRLYGRPDPLNFDFCDVGAYEFDAFAPFTIEDERLQIVHAPSPMTDYVNTAFTFFDNGPGAYPPPPNCDEGNNAINGIAMVIYAGSCGELPDIGLGALLAPFVVHKIGSATYGTYFDTNSLGSVSARLGVLPTPDGSCGEWTLNVEFSGLNLNDFGPLGTAPGPKPFALLLIDGDGNEGCFDIDNAIVGGKIIPPTVPVVRRGARR